MKLNNFSMYFRETMVRRQFYLMEDASVKEAKDSIVARLLALKLSQAFLFCTASAVDEAPKIYMERKQ